MSPLPSLIVLPGSLDIPNRAPLSPAPRPERFAPARRWARWCSAWSRGGLTLIAVCLAVYLAGLFTIGPVDRDESRFAQSSRQMFESIALPAALQDPALHSGKLAIPYYDTRTVNGVREGKPRLNKPPLVYWLQVTSAAVFTLGDPRADAIWMYRVPSVLAAIIAVLATWRLGLGMFDPRAAWLGALILAVCPIVAWEAHQARADMLLLACCTVMMLALWRIWHASIDPNPKHARRTKWLMPILFWAALSAGVMTKGPIAPLLAACAILWLCISTRSWAWLARLRPLMGLLILIAAVAPWVALVAQQIGLGAYLDILNKEIVQRATVGSSEGHFGPPGMHTLAAFALLGPGSIGLIHGVIRGWKRGRPHIPPSPTLPRFRTGEVSCLHDGGGEPDASGPRQRPSPSSRPAEWFLIAWLVPTWIVFELITSKLLHYTLPMYPALALLSARAILGKGERWTRVFAWIAAAWTVLAVAGLQFVAPWVAPGANSRAIMREVRVLDPTGTLPIASSHREDSMLFWTRGRVVRAGDTAMKEWLDNAALGPRLAVVRARDSMVQPTPTLRGVPDPIFGSPDLSWEVMLLSRSPAPASGASP